MTTRRDNTKLDHQAELQQRVLDFEEELKQFEDLSVEFGGTREFALRDIGKMLETLRELQAPAVFHGQRSKMTLEDTRGGKPDLAADCAGGDVDPGFGYDPEDSEQLLELRQAIDSYLGWKNQEDEERGDYVFRVREIGDLLWNMRAGFIKFRSAKFMAKMLASTLRRTPANELDELQRAIDGDPGCIEGDRPTHEDLVAELDSIDHVLEINGLDATGLKGITQAIELLSDLGLATLGIDGIRKRFMGLVEHCSNQRRELRRLNRDARIRAEGRHGSKVTTLLNQEIPRSP